MTEVTIQSLDAQIQSLQNEIVVHRARLNACEGAIAAFQQVKVTLLAGDNPGVETSDTLVGAEAESGEEKGTQDAVSGGDSD